VSRTLADEPVEDLLLDAWWRGGRRHVGGLDVIEKDGQACQPVDLPPAPWTFGDVAAHLVHLGLLERAEHVAADELI
jgi:hypothetical protein